MKPQNQQPYTGKQQKIFGIGLSKTGGTSLAKALIILGYRARRARTMKEIRSHDASTDSVVAWRYEILDSRFPDSKFILTVREIESWLESCRKHFARTLS